MPEPSSSRPSSSSSSGPGSRGKSSGLKRKLGPLPLWAWLALAGGAALAYFVVFRRPSVEPGGPVELVTGAGAGRAGATEQAYGGYPAANGAPAGGLAPGVLDDLLAQNQTLGSQLQNLPDRISESLAYNLGGAWEGGRATFPGEGVESGVDPASIAAAVVEALGGRQPASPAAGKPSATSQSKPPRGGSRPPAKPAKPKARPAKPPKRKPPRAAAPPPKSKPSKPPAPRTAPRRPARRGAGGAIVRSA